MAATHGASRIPTVKPRASSKPSTTITNRIATAPYTRVASLPTARLPANVCTEPGNSADMSTKPNDRREWTRCASLGEGVGTLGISSEVQLSIQSDPDAHGGRGGHAAQPALRRK